MPLHAGEPELSAPDAFRAGPYPLVTLLLSLVELLVRDYSVQPQTGERLHADRLRTDAFLPCDDTQIGLSALTLGLDSLDQALSPDATVTMASKALLVARFWRFRHAARNQGMSLNALEMLRAAARRDIPFHRLGASNRRFRLGQGTFGRTIAATLTDACSQISHQLVDDKLETNRLLAAQGIPTPGTLGATSAEQAVERARQLGYPVVVKPRGLGRGMGIRMGLLDDQAVADAFAAAAEFGTGVVLERQIPGHDHRLLVVGGRLVAAATRLPGAVTGDGCQSVRQLVDRLNLEPNRSLPHDRWLDRIVIDQEAIDCLAAASLTLDSVPEKGRRVELRRTANLSRGGIAIDVTDSIHPDNRRLAERVARLMRLDVAGIDLITPDIHRSWREEPGAIIEVNRSPGLGVHLGADRPRDVAGPIIESLFAAGETGRIPTLGITGSVGKTTTCRMVAAILAEAGKTVALSTTQGAWIGQDTVHIGDVACGTMARTLLLDPAAEVGVFELARGGLLKYGMDLDAVDVGMVLNLLDNHIGQDGIINRETLAEIKALVVRHARHLAILNADDPLCLGMRRGISADRICLVSERADHPAILDHLATGGLAAYLQQRDSGPELTFCRGERMIGSLLASAIPDTWDGRFRPAIVNALFAAAAAHGMGMPFATIASALGNFRSTPETNPDRMNVIEGLPYQLIVTKAGNPEALAEISAFVDTLPIQGRRHLMLAIGGHRSNQHILDSARVVAGHFSTFITSDLETVRDRPAGEVARLIARGLADAGIDGDAITIAASHDEAVELAFRRPLTGDLLVVITYGSLRPLQMVRELLKGA